MCIRCVVSLCAGLKFAWKRRRSLTRMTSSWPVGVTSQEDMHRYAANMDGPSPNCPYEIRPLLPLSILRVIASFLGRRCVWCDEGRPVPRKCELGLWHWNCLSCLLQLLEDDIPSRIVRSLPTDVADDGSRSTWVSEA